MDNTFIAEQAGSLLFTFALGLLMGVLYDFQKALRVVLGAPRRWSFPADLLYWLFMTALVFPALLADSWGEVRFYVFLGLGAGVLFYSWLLTGVLYLFMLKILSWQSWLLFWLTMPVVAAIRILGLIFFQLFRKSGKALGGGIKALRKLTAGLCRRKKE